MPPKKKIRIEGGEVFEEEEEEGAEEAAGAVEEFGTETFAVATAATTTQLMDVTGRRELEADAPDDRRPRLKEPVVFLTPDTTINVMQATEGDLLMTLNEGGLQYLLAGVRASTGIKCGRYMFEARIVENLNQVEVTGSQVRTPLPRNLLRIGFSLAGGVPLLGDSEDGICFDSEGNFLFNRKRSPVSQKFAADDTIAVVLNLYDEGSPNASTISLFKEGERACAPQPLPENLQGQVLFPTLTFRNVSVHVNFGPQHYVPLPFACRMLQDASEEDVVITTYPKPADGKYEVMLPVMLPDEGTFDWMDWFLKRNPQYAELSERMIVSWALRSGLWRPKTHTYKSSHDKPDMNFGIPHLDDGSVKQVLSMAATAQQRDIIIMEVKGNLTKQDRMEMLQRFHLPHFKTVARVMMGEPEDEYKAYVQKSLLAEKQARSDAEFHAKKQERIRQKLMAAKQKQMERARKKAERKQDGDKGEEAGEEAKEEKPEGEEFERDEAKGEEDDDVDEEPLKLEEDEDNDEPPPKVQLSDAESREWFRRPGVLSDISQFVLSQTYHRFALPGDDEGFDEIQHAWGQREDCLEAMRRWNLDRKASTRIDDLQPSDWFREKWQEWQRDLQVWHMKHMEFKDPHKRAAIIAAAAKAALKEKEKENQKNGEKKVEDKDENKEVKDENNDVKNEKKDEDGKEVKDENTPPENKAKEEVKQEQKEEEDDPMKALEEELDRAELDIFGVDNISDIGTGEPLFSEFAFEDWALLSLRFELHLLVHAFQNDCADEERTGIHPEHLAFYYNKYYKKGLNPKNYGVDTVEDLIALIRDTVIICSKVVESQLSGELETNEIFVRLTEEGRRERQRRLDSGDESAALKFQSRPPDQTLTTMGRPAGGGGGPPMRPSLTGMQKGKQPMGPGQQQPMRMQAPPGGGKPYPGHPGGKQWAPRYGGLKGNPGRPHYGGRGGRGGPYQQNWRYGAPAQPGAMPGQVGQPGTLPPGQVGGMPGPVGGMPGQVGGPVGTHPGMYGPPPGQAPGPMPGQNPGMMPGQAPPGPLPGQTPGMLPGQLPPGPLPGQAPAGPLPGQLPGQAPGPLPGSLPGHGLGQLPGQAPPGSLPGQPPPGSLPGQMPSGPLMGQAPLGQAPLGQAPLGQPPLGQPPLGQPPLGQPPLGQPPLGQPPLGQPPLGQPPLGQPPLGQPPLGQPPLGQPPLGQPPLGQPPLGQPPLGQPPLGQPPLGQPPLGQVPLGQAPPGTLPGHAPPGSMPGQGPPGLLPGQAPPGSLPGQAPPGPMHSQAPLGPLPGQVPPGPLPGQAPLGPLPGQAPGPLPGQTPGPLPGQAPGPLLGHPPGSLPGHAPGPLQGLPPGSLPGHALGPLPGHAPGSLPGHLPGQIPGQLPGLVPGQMPGQ